MTYLCRKEFLNYVGRSIIAVKKLQYMYFIFYYYSYYISARSNTPLAIIIHSTYLTEPFHYGHKPSRYNLFRSWSYLDKDIFLKSMHLVIKFNENISMHYEYIYIFRISKKVLTKIYFSCKLMIFCL